MMAVSDDLSDGLSATGAEPVSNGVQADGASRQPAATPPVPAAT